MLVSDKNGVQRTLEEHEDVEAGAEVAEQPAVHREQKQPFRKVIDKI